MINQEKLLKYADKLEIEARNMQKYISPLLAESETTLKIKCYIT